jgi:hypothetical protein
MTKSIQLAIIQAFIALWEIIFEQMVAIWNFLSEDEDKLVYKYHKCIKAIIKSLWSNNYSYKYIRELSNMG